MLYSPPKTSRSIPRNKARAACLAYASKLEPADRAAVACAIIRKHGPRKQPCKPKLPVALVSAWHRTSAAERAAFVGDVGPDAVWAALVDSIG